MIKVLLVESSEKIQNQLTAALKNVKFEVVAINEASDALSKLNETHFDMVLFRDKFEDSTAVEHVSEIRKTPKFIGFPIIVIYGKMNSKEKLDAWKSGADDVVSMPFVLPELLMQLHIRLKKTNLYRELQPPPGLVPEKTPSLSEADGDERLPFHGLIESYPIPYCFAWIYLRQASGVFRLIEGKHIRSFYIENGFVRGAHSTRKEESYYRFILKTMTFSGEAKRDFKALPETISDIKVVEAVKTLSGLQQEILNSLAIQYIQSISSAALQNSKGEFDWAPEEKPEEIFQVSFRGIHPAHLLLNSLRHLTPAPDFSHLLIGKELRLVPNASEGVLSQVYNLIPVEAGLLSLTANGITLNNWLRQAGSILPYAPSLMYTLLSFKAFKTTEQEELSLGEIFVVKLPEPIDDQSIKQDGSQLSVVDDDQIPEQTDRLHPITTPKHINDFTSNDKTDTGLHPVIKQAGPPTKPVASSKEAKPVSSVKNSTLLDRELQKFNEQPITPKHRRPTVTDPLLEKESQKRNVSLFDEFGLMEQDLTEGHTWETHPVLVIVLAIKFKKTGTLIFTDAASQTKLFWRNGNLLYAKTNKPEFRIDKILFDLGLINEEQRIKASDLWDTSAGMRSGTGLFQQKIVSINALTDAVREQIHLIIQDVCNMPAGDYKFNSNELPDSEYVAFDIITERAFMRGIRNLEELDVFEKIVPSLSVTFTLAPDAITKAHDAHLEGVDINILNRFRKNAALKAVFAETDLDIKKFKNTIVGLGLLGYLEKQRTVDGF
ncbi:MAG: response regulator [bacterium]